jgi:hypothetical protein
MVRVRNKKRRYIATTPFLLIEKLVCRISYKLLEIIFKVVTGKSLKKKPFSTIVILISKLLQYVEVFGQGVI